MITLPFRVTNRKLFFSFILSIVLILTFQFVMHTRRTKGEESDVAVEVVHVVGVANEEWRPVLQQQEKVEGKSVEDKDTVLEQQANSEKDAQPQTTTTTTPNSQPPSKEEEEGTKIEQETEQDENEDHNEEIEDNFWQKQFENTDAPHPLIVNRQRALSYEWWMHLDARRDKLEVGKEFQIDRDMYKQSFDHVINTTVSLLSTHNQLSTENSPYVYATFIRFSHTELLPGNTQYIHGVVALVASWVQSKSPFPFIILHTGPCPPNLKKRLESIPSHSLKLIHIDDSFVPLPPTMQSYDAWRVSFQKLAIFSLKQYEKIVFLDSDTMLVQNVDELFGLPAFSAGRDNCERCQFGRGMNAGVFVLEPSDRAWQGIKDYTMKESCLSKVFKWSDQELLVCLFDQRRPLVENLGRWYQLPFVYNAFINNCGCRDESKRKDPMYAKWKDDEVKIAHYTCSGKPWDNLNTAGRDRADKPKSCQDRFNGKWLAFWDKGMELLGMNATMLVNGSDAVRLLFSP